MFIPVVWQVSCMHGIYKWLSKDCQIYLIPHCSSRHLYSTFVITLHFLLMENHMGVFLSSIIINLPFIITNCFVDIGAIAEFLEWYWFVEHWPFSFLDDYNVDLMLSWYIYTGFTVHPHPPQSFYIFVSQAVLCQLLIQESVVRSNLVNNEFCPVMCTEHYWLM